MKRLFLFHWNPEEARERAERLGALGYAVRFEGRDGAEGARELKTDPPDAVVIDLGRLPSHGRQMATWIRQRKATRFLPIVFVKGDPSKTKRLQADFPDAQYATWETLPGSLAAALAAPRPPAVAIPKRPDYSGTPLPKKLGVKAGCRLALLGAPLGFRRKLAPLPDGVSVATDLRRPAELTLLFLTSRKELESRLPVTARRVPDPGGLWVIWPKKAAKTGSDLNEDLIRKAGIEAGLLDNKVCAVDEVWSALRLAHRRNR